MLNQLPVSKRCTEVLGPRSVRAVHIVAIMALAASISSAVAQVDANHFARGKGPEQGIVSKNQLLTPEKALRATDRARDDLAHGHLDAARKQIVRALDVAPHCALALDMQGAIDVQTGRLDEAVTAFQDAIDNDPTLGSAYLGLGMVFVGQGRFKDALTPLDRATAFLPSAWIVYLEIGLAQLGLGNTDHALEQAARAGEFTGSDLSGKSGVSFLRALSQLQLRNMNLARIYLFQTISFDPHGPYAPLARRQLERLQPLLADAK